MRDIEISDLMGKVGETLSVKSSVEGLAPMDPAEVKKLGLDKLPHPPMVVRVSFNDDNGRMGPAEQPSKIKETWRDK